MNMVSDILTQTTAIAAAVHKASLPAAPQTDAMLDATRNNESVPDVVFTEDMRLDAARVVAEWAQSDDMGQGEGLGDRLLALIVELLNSAIEAAIDRISLERHPLSKNAKDMGSAAQFVALGMIASVWAVILLG